MTFVLRPWQLYLVVLAGWIHRQQQETIEHLRTENQVLKERRGSKRTLISTRGSSDHAGNPRSSDDVVDDVSLDVGETEVATAVTVDEPCVIQAK